MALTDGRTIIVYAADDQVTLGDLRQLVGMANAPVEIPDSDGRISPAMDDDAVVRTFHDGRRAGILLERR